MANCKSCGAEILWGTTIHGGKMPLAVSTEEKRWVFPAEGSDHVRVFKTYKPHFADCPNAAMHRKPKNGI